MDYFLSLNGIFTAQRSLEQSVRRIATPQPATDFAEEAITLKQSKIAVEANHRVIKIGTDLESTLLDLFA
jgi:hypothetical protein